VNSFILVTSVYHAAYVFIMQHMCAYVFSVRILILFSFNFHICAFIFMVY